MNRVYLEGWMQLVQTYTTIPKLYNKYNYDNSDSVRFSL